MVVRWKNGFKLEGFLIPSVVYLKVDGCCIVVVCGNFESGLEGFCRK